MNFSDIFRAQNDCLVIGFLMDTETFEFWHRNILILAFFVLVVAVTIRADFLSFEGGILFVDFTLVCCQPDVVNNRKNTH